MALGAVAALGGIWLAFRCYVQRLDWPAQAVEALGGAATAAQQRFYFDETYDAALAKPMAALAAAAPKFDRDHLGNFVEAIGLMPALAGRALRRLQSGYLQSYAGWMAAGAAVLPLVALAGLAGAAKSLAPKAAPPGHAVPAATKN